MDPDRMLHFVELAWNLKKVRRQGWVDRGVSDPESSADHSWGVAFLAWLLAAERDDLNRDRVMLLGLVHDLPESIAGDVTPFDLHRDSSGTIPDEFFREAPAYNSADRVQKVETERVAMQRLLDGMPESIAREISDAWSEYEAAETPEARFVKQVDKLETLLQAEIEYRADPRIIIDSFRLGARRDVEDDDLRTLVEALLARRTRDGEDI